MRTDRTVGNIGFIGAGRMGSRMVRRLVDAGLTVRVLVRTVESRESVSADLGVEAVVDLSELASNADCIVICVHSDTQVRDLCMDRGLLDFMNPGSILIVHTTGSPFLAREIQAMGDSRGVQVVDAPISGSPDDIAAGHVTVYAGGAPEAVDSAGRILAHYADPLIRTGALGSGQTVKLVNNAVFLSNIEILSAGTSFGAELGVDEAMLISCLQQGSARSFALEGVARTGSIDGFRRAVGEFLDKDLRVVRDVAASTTADLGVIGTVAGCSPSNLAGPSAGDFHSHDIQEVR